MLGKHKIIAFVGTTNAARAKAFYGDILGLELIEEGKFALVFDANGTMLRVTPVKEIAPASYTVLGWEVPDVASAAAELAAGGVKFERYAGVPQDEQGVWTSPGGAKVAWFKDPDGNTLSISQH